MTLPARAVVQLTVDELARIATALERIATAMESAATPKARPVRTSGAPAAVPTDEDHAEVSRRLANGRGTARRRRAA